MRVERAISHVSRSRSVEKEMRGKQNGATEAGKLKGAGEGVEAIDLIKRRNESLGAMKEEERKA